jgi:hypothetical protein
MTLVFTQSNQAVYLTQSLQTEFADAVTPNEVEAIP